MRGNGGREQDVRNATQLPVFSYLAPEAYFRIVRRGGRWYVEYDGAVAGGFDNAQAAAEALAMGRVRLEGLDVEDPQVPANLACWYRGDLCRSSPAHGRAACT
jgi:hypothetical protein